MIRSVMAGMLATVLLGSDLEPLERVGRLSAPAIREASGMVASRRFPGIFWVHNDSRNPPELFAVRRDGQLVRSYPVAAPNVDWEDIATDDSGHLYLGDTGDNLGVLPIRVILKIDEPDPTRLADAEVAKPLAILTATHYQYPARQRFDAEGLVVVGDQALIVTKRRDHQLAEVYRLPLQPAAPWHPLTADRVGVLPGCVEPVTGASLTPDGRTLAVVTDRSVRVYESAQLADWTLVGSTSFDAPDVEAITWEGTDLILASEDRSIYRVPDRRWRTRSKEKR